MIIMNLLTKGRNERKNSPEDDYELATVVGALLWPSSWRASVECRVKEKTKKAIEWEDREESKIQCIFHERFNAGINWNTKRCQSMWRVSDCSRKL